MNNELANDKLISKADQEWYTQLTKIVSTAVSYSVRAGDDVILVTATSTVTLPNAVRGRSLKIKKYYSGGTVTVTPQTGQTIDGSASLSITTTNQTVTLKAHQNNWILL